MPSHRNKLGMWGGIVLCALAFLLFFQHLASAAPIYTFGVLPSSVAVTQQNPTKAPTKTTSPAKKDQNKQTASQKIIAGHSWDPNQYSTDQGLNYWSYRACSSFSLWSTFNSWGKNIPKAGDVIAVQLKPEVGSLGDSGIWIKSSAYTNVADYYGFNSDYGSTRSLDQIISIANSGYPVIVGISGNVYGREYNKSYYQTEWLDHILVIKGGDATTVQLVDSSKFDLTSMKRSAFESVWGGMSFVVWPKNVPAPK